MKIAVFFANGTEELEALTPVDILRRAGAVCDLVSVSGEYPVGSHGICVKADKLVNDVCFADYDALVIPGGMPGAINVAQNSAALTAVKDAVNKGKLVCAICAAPAVMLADNGLLNGVKATCYPAQNFVDSVRSCAEYVETNVVSDGNFITANGPKSAFSFALEICKKLGLQPAF